MDVGEKKTALRMIPYALYVLTAEAEDGRISAATVSWVTQASFEPTLLVVAVKADSGAHAIIKDTGAFALNILGKDQGPLASEFFKPTARDGDKVGGQSFHRGATGAPIFDSVPAWVECKLTDTIEKGDHSVFVGEVVGAGVQKPIEGRPDDLTLMCRDLGEKIFYAG